MQRCFNKMQRNDFMYVSLILEILYFSSTKRSYLMTLRKKFIQIWPERVKIHFMNKKKTQLAKPIIKKNYYCITDKRAKRPLIPRVR